jgi:hypothetical protein
MPATSPTPVIISIGDSTHTRTPAILDGMRLILNRVPDPKAAGIKDA